MGTIPSSLNICGIFFFIIYIIVLLTYSFFFSTIKNSLLTENYLIFWSDNSSYNIFSYPALCSVYCAAPKLTLVMHGCLTAFWSCMDWWFSQVSFICTYWKSSFWSIYPWNVNKINNWSPAEILLLIYVWVEVQELDIFILVNVEALKKYTAFQYINIMSSLAWITVMHVKKTCKF